MTQLIINYFKFGFLSTHSLRSLDRYLHCGFSCFCFLFISSLFFLAWPQIDVIVSNYFYDGFGYFPLNDNGLVNAVYVSVPWIGRAIFLTAVIVVLIAIFAPTYISRRHWRRAASVTAIVVLGIGFLVHAVLKDGMGRPRPRDIQTFSGPTSFVPAFTSSQFCTTNCSFVSGHAAVGFSLMSLGMLGIRRRRNFWFYSGLVAGFSIGFVRIAQGGHFLSDVIFSFFAIWAIHLLIRAVWLRFRFWQLLFSSNRNALFKVIP